jgi:hypothetical protein
VASTIVVTPSRNDVELAGPVEFVSSPLIVVLGIEIDTSSIPPDGFFEMVVHATPTYENPPLSPLCQRGRVKESAQNLPPF